MKKFAAAVFLLCLFLAPAIFSSPAAPQTVPASPDNPFFKPYGTPFNVPPFHLIKNEYFLPAIEEGIKREQAEIDAVINDPKPPTFENTIAALDHTGIFLSEVNGVFGALQGANTNKELQALARKTAPMLAAHRDNIGLNEKLFLRVKTVYDQRNNLKLDREQLFLLENTYLNFVRGGAWSGGFRRSYYENGRKVPPVATIVCNFTRPTADVPSLLSTDEVETFFHEFGHTLATLFSQSRYRSRNIARDSVELPSQIMEHWALEPELLALYAKHYKTGELIPAGLVEKIKKSSLFNQGFVTEEYLAASFLDMAWHTLPNPAGVDVRQFENQVLARIGLIPEIVPRYRSTYFNHIFSGGYAAGYYAYIWSEVLDCDAYEAFKEKGIFDRATALSFRKNILEPFGTEDPMTQYVRFRGAEPKIEPLLRKRGLEVKN